ncbi:rod shape-determining protein MreC [Alphaproteobacteria bacterium]|nr:rod shape-determining protein MreC [Alphaproteobacteria bacterium]
MAGRRKQISGGRTVLNAAGISLIFAMISILVLYFVPRDDPGVGQVRQTISELMSPIIRLLSLPAGVVDNLASKAQSYVSLAEERDALKLEVSQLAGARAELERTKLLLGRYRELLDINLDPDLKTVAGTIYADLRGPFAKTLLIDLGTNDGIQSGQSVVGPKGLLGRIVTVGDTSSRVILVTDFNSRIPVVIGTNRERAIMTGDNRAEPYIDFAQADAQINTDMLVVTSGDGGSVPAGLLLGVIKIVEGYAPRVELFQAPETVTQARVILAEHPSLQKLDLDLPAILGPDRGLGE